MDDRVFILALVVVGFPMLAMTGRFLIKAVVDGILRLRGTSGAGGRAGVVSSMQAQILELQGQVDELRSELDRVQETTEFYAALQRGSAGQLEPPATPEP